MIGALERAYLYALFYISIFEFVMWIAKGMEPVPGKNALKFLPTIPPLYQG